MLESVQMDSQVELNCIILELFQHESPKLKLGVHSNTNYNSWKTTMKYLEGMK